MPEAIVEGAGKAGADGREPGHSLGVASVPNLRDMGGYPTATGRIVRHGLLFRSNQLNPISAADLDRLAQLGLRTDFDLRTTDERNARPDQLPARVDNVWLDVLADAAQSGPAQLEKFFEDPKAANDQLGGGRIEAMFVTAYQDIVSLPSAQKSYSALFRALGEAETLPALFHCTTGKDRTGWAAASFLMLMGASPETVRQDYLRSNQYILPAYKDVIDRFVAAGGDADIPEAILGVRPTYLKAALDEMTTRYGTIEGYFADALSIEPQLQQHLIDRFTHPA